MCKFCILEFSCLRIGALWLFSLYFGDFYPNFNKSVADEAKRWWFEQMQKHRGFAKQNAARQASERHLSVGKLPLLLPRSVKIVTLFKNAAILGHMRQFFMKCLMFWADYL